MSNYDNMSTGQILEAGARQVPSKVAVIDGKRRVTYQELNNLADAFAASLADQGFKKGDRVVMYMKNSLEFIVIFYALQKLGVIVAWANPSYRKTEAHFILSNSEAKAVFVFKEWEGYNYLEALLELKNELPLLQSIFVVGEAEVAGVYTFDAMIKNGQGRKYSKPEINPQADLSMFIYTSGTTGMPKGTMITQAQAAKAGIQYALGVDASSEDVFIGFLPMCHSYGCGSILIQPFLLMASVVLLEKFSCKDAFEIIQRERVTLQLGSPAHYLMELNNPDLRNYDLSSLRAGLIAGQIAPEGLITKVHNDMGVYLTTFWGASEVGPGLGIICPYPSPLETREKYIGLPVAGTAVHVVDPLTKKEMPDGEIGELALSGWHVMKGYWKNPEETRKQIVDGWLFMGDLVSKAADGYLKIHGRIKDLINRGGFKISPYELESIMMEHPAVEQACVVATPNPVLGENICACVITKPGATLSLKELREFLKGKVAPFKLPDELCLLNDFPRLSGGVKINKFGKGGLVELAQQDSNRQKARA
ncbi:MAG: class I adenylate-forming enzyme family protein [Syntrophales bacterium]